MSVSQSVSPAGKPPVPRRARIARRPAARRSTLVVHIVAGVGLLGSVAAVLNIRAAGTGDAQLAAASYELLAMFTLLFGIPLSFIALSTGILFGLAARGASSATRGSPQSSRCWSASSSLARSCSAPAPTPCATASAARGRA